MKKVTIRSLDQQRWIYSLYFNININYPSNPLFSLEPEKNYKKTSLHFPYRILTINHIVFRFHHWTALFGGIGPSSRFGFWTIWVRYGITMRLTPRILINLKNDQILIKHIGKIMDILEADPSGSIDSAGRADDLRSREAHFVPWLSSHN